MILNFFLRFTIQFDDGLIKTGNKENVRALTAGWFDEIDGLQRRFLQISEEFNKNADSLRKTIKEATAKYRIPDDYILLSDAASSNMAISRNSDREHTTCGDHCDHNAFKNGCNKCAERNASFKEFLKLIEQTLEKSSRIHLNHLMIHNENWRKLKQACQTRWCSLIDAVESILRVWDILAVDPRAKDLPLFKKVNGQPIITKNLLEEFFNMIEPFRRSIKKQEGYKQSSGQYVAIELQNLLIYYINFNADSSNSTMLRELAREFTKQIEEYFDGVKDGRHKKMKRIDSIRLLQAAFYIPTNMLQIFKSTKIKDENKKPSVDRRYERMETELRVLIEYYEEDFHPNLNSSNSTFNQHFGKKPLETEVFLFTNIAEKYARNKQDDWPPYLIEFQQNLDKKLDAHSIFWNSNYAKETLPLLRKIIVPLLPVSASTSMVESTFSHVNQIRTAKRSRLLTSNIDSFLVCHYARLLTSRLDS